MHNKRTPVATDPVFIKNGKPWKCWRTAFENALKRAGISDFRFHDTRHHFGSWLEMTGTSGKTQMELMGHKDRKMTMRYTHLSVEHKRRAVANLPSFGVLQSESPQIPPQEEPMKVVGFRK